MKSIYLYILTFMLRPGNRRGKVKERPLECQRETQMITHQMINLMGNLFTNCIHTSILDDN